MTTIDVLQENPEEVGELIERKELDSDQSEVVFEDISDRFNYLEIYIEPIDPDDSAKGEFFFNDDEDTANYEVYRLRFDDSTEADIRDSRIADFIGSHPVHYRILGISNADMKTTFVSQHTRASSGQGSTWAGWWDDESVVSKLKVNNDDSQFSAGSTFTLIGVE